MTGWSAVEIQQLVLLRKVELRQFPDIAVMLGTGRSKQACCTKYAELMVIEVRNAAAAGVSLNVDKQWRGRQNDKPNVPPYPRAEHKTITAWLLGDPLPGRSALDRKLEAQSA